MGAWGNDRNSSSRSCGICGNRSVGRVGRAGGPRRCTAVFARGWVRVWCRAFGGDRFTVLTARRGGGAGWLGSPAAAAVETLDSPTNYHSPEYGFLAPTVTPREDLAAAALRGVRRAVVLSFVDSAGETGAAHRRAARQAAPTVRDQDAGVARPYVATEDHEGVRGSPECEAACAISGDGASARGAGNAVVP